MGEHGPAAAYEIIKMIWLRAFWAEKEVGYKKLIADASGAFLLVEGLEK